MRGATSTRCRLPALLAAALAGLAVAGCRDAESERATPPPDAMASADALGEEWRRELGPFLATHWQLPIAPQGEAPQAWSEIERSLDPTDCGSCHPKQWSEWQSSLHAAAFSPGFSGQLLEGPLSEAGALRNCQSCHTPLAEQQPLEADGTPNPTHDPALRAQGIVCASCHVRSHRRIGPPRSADAAPPPADGALPHGGFEVRDEFSQARFCAPCHQFFDDPGIDGKPVQNTWFEWKQSPQAAEGRSCQSCHMPGRAHLWRGIHDPEMVRAAVDVDLVPFELEGEKLDASLVVRNRDVGHYFPTYITPRVFLAVWQQGADGEPIEGTRLDGSIGREVDFSARPRRDRFDTRVPPGESVRLDYRLARAAGAVALVGRVTVEPDFHYRRVFEAIAPRARHPEARARLEEALRRTSESSYLLAEARRPLPAR